MDSPDDSATGRRSHRQKPDLNINTSASMSNIRGRDRDREREREKDRERERGRERDRSREVDGAPQTPPGRVPPELSKGKGTAASGGRALRLPTNTTRGGVDMESFLESLTPVDIAMPMPMLSSSRDRTNDRPDPPRPNPRDSHDLSLSPRQVTRDSLVTNMLLSLDQLSMGQVNSPFSGGGGPRTTYDDFSSFGNDDGRTMTFNSRQGRGNTVTGTGAGHGYSYSSDLEGADDMSRVSSQHSRGRRSNSSSGFQSSLGRINSMRELGRQQSIPGTPRHLHSRGGKNSKSSSTNSIDAGGYAQVLSSQRWARGFGGRSSSFDYGDARTNTMTAAAPAPSVNQQSPWHIEFSKSFFDNDDYDAAPTPTVPGGPRKLATVPSMPVLPPPEPRSPKLPPVERRRSTRSSKSATVGRKSDVKYRDSREPPRIPAFDLDSAPAPHVGYEKSKEVVATPVPQPKEKAGFFRRMFGSSKTSLLSSTSSPQPSPTSFDTAASRNGAQSKPPSRESHHSTHQSTTHSLQKKTSSFFRRRKQSITDTEPPPMPTVPILPSTAKLPRAETLSARPEPSPITSLRKAMDPFLQESATAGVRSRSRAPDSSDARLESHYPNSKHDEPPSPPPPKDGSDDERRHYTRGFSPDYEPDPKAVIRPVLPESGAESSAGRTPTITTPSRQPPEPPAQSPPKSFLQDNSDSEDSPKRVRKSPPPQNRNDGGLKPVLELDKRRRSPSPTVSKSKSSPNLGRPRENARNSQRMDENKLGMLVEGGKDGRYKDSNLPGLKVDSAGPGPDAPRTGESVDHSNKSIDEPEFVVGDPTEDDRQKAQKIFDGDEEYIQKDRAAAWMGEEGPVRQRTLRAYMDLFDFENQTIVNSLRQMCQRLLLRAETQQVDRILVAFSKRWCDCNPNHGFKCFDIIHTICYSIILLNTDLHMADIEHKMSRSQFIKNTMTTIRQVLEDSAPDAFERPSILPGKGNSLGVDGDGRQSGEHENRRNSFRASFKPPPRPSSALGMFSDHRQTDQAANDGSGPLVKAPFEGSLRGWESQIELVLKDIYASIRDDCLPLVGSDRVLEPASSGLSVMGVLKRSPSVLSKAPSEGVASVRGRISESAKANSSRWNSKSRSRPRVFGTGFSSSRTSFDDGTSMWSPTESSATWSKASLGRTHTTMSMDSFGSSYPRGDYQQSIGFANALSQAIIREDNALDFPMRTTEEVKSEQLLDDDSLELAGPPWIKEGIVTHKHHLDGVDKRAKDRNWTEVFAVIQKGTLSLFSFSPNKSIRNKGRLRGHLAVPGKGAVVGGGNWQDNATNLGTFSLRQTLASALPPPGYSRSRPHVWALSLPTGAVHLFQVGTPEISKEFVSTANYWGARLSTHPLVGGVSNIEYGWSDAIINNALVNAINDSNTNLNNNGRPGTSMSSHRGHSRPGSETNAINSAAIMASIGRTSLQSRNSMRSSSFDFALNRPGSGSSGVLGNMGASVVGSSHLPSRHGHKLPGDRIHIADWSPPTQSMRTSTFTEPEQCDALLNYVRSIEEELQSHNSLRSPMLLAFSPRSSNATKAMANWERKSEYLLREIVKFRTYVDCLQAARQRKAEIYAERETARKALRGEEFDSDKENESAATTTGPVKKEVENGGEGEKKGIQVREMETGNVIA